MKTSNSLLFRMNPFTSSFWIFLSILIFAVRLQGAPIESAVVDALVHRATVIVVAETKNDGMGITRSGAIAGPGQPVLFDDATFVFSVHKTLKGDIDSKEPLPVIVPLVGAFHIGREAQERPPRDVDFDKWTTVATGLYRHRIYVLFLVNAGTDSQRSVNGQKVRWTLADPFAGFLPVSEQLVSVIQEVRDSKDGTKK